MSGEETESEVSGREKQLVGVPVQWVDHKLTEMCHAVDTWKSAINDQSFSSPRGNRPLTRLPRSKKPVPGKPTKGLPRNWYDDTWFKSQPDSKKLLLNIAAFRRIPTIVSLYISYISTNLLAQQTAAPPPSLIGLVLRWQSSLHPNFSYTSFFLMDSYATYDG